MNASFIVCLVACIGLGVYALYLRNLDRADEYHLLHGPASDCIECEGK
ncbi:hypothetical protein SRABI26_02680 [Arthrobacter sp. Bi26]|nr:hypothetical protein SRABI26_02680 [Arthrobacter sp. Bi26]